MDFWKVIRKRRSSRDFLPDSIPDNILEKILEAGRQSPTGGNGQNHFFGVIRERNQKIKLSRAAGGQDWIAKAPVIIALCTWVGGDLRDLPEGNFGLEVNRTRFGRDLITHLNAYPDRRAVALLWENGNCLIPGEHIFLAAISFGLNACWIGYLDIEKVGEILDLPRKMACHFLMPIGYSREQPEKTEKKRLEEIVFFDSWPKEKET